MNKSKKLATTILAVVVALSLSIPGVAIANPSNSGMSSGSTATSGTTAGGTASSGTSSNGTATSTITPATNCRLTLVYNEYPSNLAPGEQPNPDLVNRLGERTISGLTKGQTINMWNYVVDIPGFFFYQGTPETLAISTNSTQNVINLYYMRSWDYEYTVNYYLMEGADLTADNWTDALAPDDVTFVKLGSQTFTDQPYDKLVEGDAYVYQMDGAYYVDSYPAQITVGNNPDNNVINILYAADSPRLPDGLLPDNGTDSDDSSNNANGGVTTPDASDDNVGGSANDATGGSTGSNAGNTNDGSTGSNEATGNTSKPDTGSNGSNADNSNNANSNESSGSSSTLPNDTTLTEDQFKPLLPGANGTLPDGMTQEQVNQLFADFLGSQNKNGPFEITDQMLANPVSPEIANATIAAYKAGLEQGSSHVETVTPVQDTNPLTIGVIVVLTILAIAGFGLFFFERHKYNQSRP